MYICPLPTSPNGSPFPNSVSVDVLCNCQQGREESLVHGWLPHFPQRKGNMKPLQKSITYCWSWSGVDTSLNPIMNELSLGEIEQDFSRFPSDGMVVWVFSLVVGQSEIPLTKICNCLNAWMSEWFLIWRFNSCGEFDFCSWRLNLMCANSDFDLYFLCFDSVWIALIWPSWLTGRYKTIIYLSTFDGNVSCKITVCHSINYGVLFVWSVLYLFAFLGGWVLLLLLLLYTAYIEFGDCPFHSYHSSYSRL